MKKNSKKILLEFKKFTIAKLDQKNSILGGKPLTDEDRPTMFRSTCFLCVKDNDEEM
jgi:hypothetical protein